MKKINPEIELNVPFDKLFGDWNNYLKDFFKSNYIHNLFLFINEVYNSNTKVEPLTKSKIFKAFKLTQMKDLKVVIIGQDPYPDGSATGLAFANEDEVRGVTSPSLLKISECIEQNVKQGFNLDFDPTLISWAEQGVLLLNTALTVQKYKIGSHSKYWKKFTTEIIKTINDNKPGTVFLLWGEHAKSYKHLINKDLHYVLEYYHPSYAARNKFFWNCTHFNEVNKIIEENNGKSECINW